MTSDDGLFTITPSDMERATRRQDRAAAAVVAAAGIVAYLNGFAGTFQFDDRSVILEDQRLAGGAVFLDQAGRMIRPLLKLTFLFDRQIYGDNPTGYHALNLLLHCGSALLVFGILSRATRQVQSESRVSRWLPFWAALLFAVHPIGTETVTYLSGRATGLAAFLTLLAMFLFLRATGPGRERSRAVAPYALALVAYAGALLSKEIAVVLPALLLLWHLLLGDRGAGGRRHTLRLHAPFWVASCLALVVAAWHPRYAVLARASFSTRPLWDNLATQVGAVAYALLLFVCPWRLNFDHDLAVRRSLLAWPTPLALLLLAGMVAVAVWGARRQPLVSLGIGWFFLCLLPTNSVIPRYDVLSERNLYLPSIGIILAVVAVADRTVARLERLWPTVVRAASGAVAVALSLALCAATIDRNSLYRDEVRFWSDAAEKSPRKARPHNNLGYAYLQAGDVDRALAEFRTALALDRDNVTARRNLLAAWRIKQGQR